MSSVHCNDQSTHLLSCRYTALVPSYCSHADDVGVRCEGMWL